MTKTCMTFAAACSLALAASPAFGQEDIHVTEWAFTNNYAILPAFSLSGETTNSPTVVRSTEGSVAFYGSFTPVSVGELEDFVTITFQFTTNGGFGGGSNLRWGVFNDNGQAPAQGGWTGYLVSVASAGNSPGLDTTPNEAGYGTLVAHPSSSGNWVSTRGTPYSILSQPNLGPTDNPAAGTYDVEITFYREDTNQLSVEVSIEGEGWLFTASGTDIGEAVASLTSLNTIAFGFLNQESGTTTEFQLSNVVVNGTPVDDPGPGPRTWAGYELDEEGYAEVAELNGWIYVWPDSDDYVYSFALGGWIFVDEGSRDAIEAGEGFWTYVWR